MLKKLSAAALLFCAMGMIPTCGQAQGTKFPPVQDWNTLVITLERTACFGSCPSYRIEVHGDGTVFYTGRRFVAFGGKHRGSIPRSSVEELVRQFQQASFFSLRDEYAWQVTDMPTFLTSIAFDGHSKTVRDYAGSQVGMPKAVSELEGAIDRLSQSERWTKGNAETVRALREERWGFQSREAVGALVRVVEYGSADAVRDMVSAGTPADALDEFGRSALDVARQNGMNEKLAILEAAVAHKTQ